ncbi:hypothetical protein BC936DRAFT_146244 [Jimgerdemannia flammicorona]|uniref:beta-glucosidase n=1 Tax=Jimgerdemannia flammicorona TaxID=994334 RepID=A0A433DLQ6_9FUNG|nr:hypothetical protein BC936DRAFT_146244 [Jimgerdemannia flammicorona]
MLKKMTIKEKIGQMTQINQNLFQLADGTINTTMIEWLQKEYFIGSYLNNLSGNGVNFNAQGYADVISTINEITLKTKSTYKIPTIYGLDVVHGAHYIANATIFPHGINQAASFNPAVPYAAAEIAAKDSRASNVLWTFAPILDLAVNKQWPRVYEDFGEDPLLASVMGAASVHGFQGNYKSNRTKIAACMKHFIGYGAPRSGEDRDSSWIPDRFLHDYFVPPFKAAIDAGTATAMESYNDINGEAVVGSKKYLRTLLRDQLKFYGMLVTDWHEIENLFEFHGVSSSVEAATELAIKETSIDMSMVPQDLTFPEVLYKLVKKGTIPVSRIDESAGRVLQLKKDLGLFEKNGWKTNKALLKTVGQKSDHEVAINGARESLTLLKNDKNTLPLGKSVKKILVVGPTANKLSYLAGGWTIAWQGYVN